MLMVRSVSQAGKICDWHCPLLLYTSGAELLEKLAETWTQFFTHILPTLEAIFVPTQISIRSVTLLSFRDHVLLKTPISEALDSLQGDTPPRIKQMLLVLQVEWTRGLRVHCQAALHGVIHTPLPTGVPPPPSLRHWSSFVPPPLLSRV